MPGGICKGDFIVGGALRNESADHHEECDSFTPQRAQASKFFLWENSFCAKYYIH